MGIMPKYWYSTRRWTIRKFCTTKLDNDDPFLNEQIPGYLGNGYEFYVDGKFEKAQLSFELDESIINDNSCI